MSFVVDECKIASGYELSLGGEFSASNTEAFLAAVDRLPLEEGDELLLQTEQIAYLDSAALGALIMVQTQLEQRGISLRLDRCSPVVEKLLEQINCLNLFRAPLERSRKERLKAYSAIGGLLSKKVNLLTILMATAGDIAGQLEEPYLCRKMVDELASLLGTDLILLYLGDSEPGLFLVGEEVTGRAHPGAPESLSPEAFAALATAHRQGIQSLVMKQLDRLPPALADYLQRAGAEQVVICPLLGMRSEQGWLILGLGAEADLLVQDNLQGIDLFVKIGALLMENVRNERLRLAQSQEVRLALQALSAAPIEEGLPAKAATTDQLLARLTRRLNNQLVPVLGYTQMILKTGQLSPIDRERLLRIENSIQSAKRLINNLMGVAIPQPLVQTSVSLNRICERTLKRLENEAAAGVEWRVRLAEDLPDGYVDAQQSALVLQQVIRNALESLQGRPEPYLSIQSRLHAEWIEFEIEDNGEGIPEEYQSRVFEPLLSLHDEVDRLGLGLSLCKTIMDLHHGEIRLESKSQVGTRVLLRWPLQHEARLPELKPPGAVEQSFGRQARIVVIDDERVCADLMQDVLSEEHEVKVFYSGQDALNYLERYDFDLVLTDLRMPEISGIQVYEWIRTHLPGREKAVAFVTGNAFEPEFRPFVETTENVVIAKPFNLGTFRKLIRVALEQLRSADSEG